MDNKTTPCKDLYEENLLKLLNDRDFITKQQIQYYPNSDKFAVIIDPRFDNIMEAVIRNFMHFMNPYGWNLIIMSHSKYESVIREKFPNCHFKPLDENMIYYKENDNNNVPNITIENYNNILLDKTFWTSLPEPAEHICIFQKDCIMFKMFQDYFYLNYDYSGANYYNQKHTGVYYGGIQGGFSLRKKSAMLECLDIDLGQMRTYRIEQYMKYLQRMNICDDSQNINVFKDMLKEPVSEDVVFTIACEMLYKMVPDKVHRTFLSIEADVNLTTCVFHGWQYEYHNLATATHFLDTSSLFGKYINNIAD